jgi:hypothetical protein
MGFGAKLSCKWPHKDSQSVVNNDRIALAVQKKKKML